MRGKHLGVIYLLDFSNRTFQSASAPREGGIAKLFLKPLRETCKKKTKETVSSRGNRFLIWVYFWNCFSILAQESLKAMVRLKTRFSSVVSGSTQK